MSKLIRSNDPFMGLSGLHSYIDDMFNDFMGGSITPSLASSTQADVYVEDDKQLVAEIHAPGFNKDNIDVSVHEGVLEISGKKSEKQEDDDKKRNYMVRESSSSFYRRFALPKHADADNVDAHFEDGVLKVTVPFKELPKPKKIQIGSGKNK